MKKNIYTGIFCTILGLCANTPANASIVSSGFLDEKLTEMTNATALQLDLKANQSDFTDLNTQISDSVDVLRQMLEEGFYGYELVNGTVNPEKFPNTISGAFNLLQQYLEAVASSTMYGWTNSKGTSYAGLVDLNNGWTDSEGNTYLGVKGLNDKIGDAWPYGSNMGNGLYNLSWQLYPQEINLENASDLVRFLFGGKIESGINHGGVLNLLGESVFYTGAYDRNTAQIIDNGFRSLSQLTNGWTDSKKKTHLGVMGLNDKIGTLPSGNFPNFPGRELLFSELNQPSTYPTSLAELINAIYGNSETRVGGLLAAIIAGFPFDTDGDGIPEPIGLIPNLQSAADASDLAKANTTKIGTLPTEIPNMDSTWTRYGFVETPGTPIDLPDTIGGMLAMLFNEDGSYEGLSLRNIMGKILMGFDPSGRGIKGLAKLSEAYDLIGDSPIVTAVNANTAKIGTVPDGKNLAGMISETDAKIGTLPTEYATVGAALTAIKGIAEDAKAAALAAIPDPKTEGSTGKFVLTVDIVGDNATYRWEPIDRGDTTTTTE